MATTPPRTGETLTQDLDQDLPNADRKISYEALGNVGGQQIHFLLWKLFVVSHGTQWSGVGADGTPLTLRA